MPDGPRARPARMPGAAASTPARRATGVSREERASRRGLTASPRYVLSPPPGPPAGEFLTDRLESATTGFGVVVSHATGSSEERRSPRIPASACGPASGRALVGRETRMPIESRAWSTVAATISKPPSLKTQIPEDGL